MSHTSLRCLVSSAVVTGLALVALACGPSTPPATTLTPVPSTSASIVASVAPPKVEDFRAKPPAKEGTVTFVAPKIVEGYIGKKGSGMRVLFVERHELPIVAVQVVSNRGAAHTAPGQCAFMAAMLTQGTKKHDAIAFADEMERLGARWGAYCGYDSVVVNGQVLSSKLAAFVPLLAEMVRTPAFDAKEIDRERKKRLTQLQQQKDTPSALAWRAVLSTLYPPGHPYGMPTIGDEATVTAVTKKSLEEAYGRTVVSNAMTLVVVGDVTEAAVMPLLETAFGDMAPKVVAATPPPPAPNPVTEPRIVVIDRPGAVQSTVNIVRVGEKRTTPEWARITLMNYVLGGHFASRINMNLREKHAYTYGAGTSFQMWQMAGPFSAGGEIKSEHTAAAIKEILEELARMRDAKISADELTEAKTGLIDQLPGRFSTMEETAGSLATLAVYALPLDEYATRPARYSATTLDEVQHLAKDYLKADDLRIVIVGDAAKIVPSLEALKFGNVEVRKPKPEPKPEPKKAGK